MNSAIIFESVSYSIGHTTILSGITLHLKKGNITGIVGPNGAGKTSLLSLINGLHRQSAGTITVLGETIPTEETTLRQRIGVVLQETALYEELTTFENLRFAASLYNIKNSTARIIAVLELLDLVDRSDQIVKTLSGGLRRRVTIARALLHNPELLIIDEPTLGVDVEARHAIWQHLRLLKSQGTTVVVATNYLDEAQALCDTVAVLREGKLLACESPETLIARAGYCLDIECSDERTEEIQKAIVKRKGILRVDRTPSGLSIFMTSNVVQKQVIDTVLKSGNLESLRVRAPDFVEVFKTLEEKL